MLQTLTRSPACSTMTHGAEPEAPAVTKTSPRAIPTPRPDAPRVWAAVLAGGQGVRLRPLVARLYDDERPKQYAALLDSRTLLRHTLDRVGLLVPPERTVIVTMRDHDRYIAGDLEGPSHPHVLWQPDDRGTAAGVLLPAHWVHARDPRAVMAVPTDPETEYGWIEPGERVGWTARGPLYRIQRFQEKPSGQAACALLSTGGLWNTFVLVASASTLISAGRACVPDLHDRLARLAAFAGTEHETWAIRQAYTLAPHTNFSRAVLEACPQRLAVAKLPGLTWCDLGTPARVERTLATLGVSPPWR
jgi:mannose-1-phosphate guanylyltransferase